MDDPRPWFEWALKGMEGFAGQAERYVGYLDLPEDQLRRLERLADRLAAVARGQRQKQT